MKNRRTFTIEGSPEQLEQILALFETERLVETSALKILDVGIVESDRSEIAPVELYRVWLNSLYERGFQPATRSIQTTAYTKTIQFQHSSIEISIEIVPLSNLEIQILLQIRSVGGKEYLPVGLKVAILDEMSEIILEQTSLDRTNLLDLTQAGNLTRDLADRFALRLMLGDETIIENFPN